MQMYIANGSHHNIDFQYRLPETKRYRQQLIPIGSQIRISGDLSEKDIASIIEQHEIYGLVEASKVSSSNGHTLYVYSLGKPVSSNQIANLVSHNRRVDNEIGYKLRQEAAVAVSSQIKDNSTDHLNSIEMEVREISKGKDTEVDEKIVVTEDEKRGAPQNPNKPIEIQRNLF